MVLIILAAMTKQMILFHALSKIIFENERSSIK